MNEIQEIGRLGERIASRYLEQSGYAVIDRNWHSRLGEIDIVATDQNNLVFVEVKTRTSLAFGHPFEAITPRKVARMRKLANEWCLTQASPGFRIRLDAIAVLLSESEPQIEHIKAVC
jgi:putative endonuclease